MPLTLIFFLIFIYFALVDTNNKRLHITGLWTFHVNAAFWIYAETVVRIIRIIPELFKCLVGL